MQLATAARVQPPRCGSVLGPQRLRSTLAAAPLRAAPRHARRALAACAVAASEIVGRYTAPRSAAGNVVVEVCADEAAVAQYLCSAVEKAAAEAVAARGYFTLAIPGGSVLKALKGLAGRSIPWDKTRIFFVNHKCVPVDDGATSSYAKARALFLDAAGAAGCAAALGGSDDATAEAERYASLLRAAADELGMERARCGTPRFDLLLLGVGSDGHVGSLYPTGAAAMGGANSSAWVLPVVKSKPPPSVTLSLDVMKSAKSVVICLTGASKAAAAKTALETAVPTGDFPAQLVQPDEAPAVWLLDVAAAAKLELAEGTAAEEQAAQPPPPPPKQAAQPPPQPPKQAAAEPPQAAPAAPQPRADPHAGQLLPDGSVLYQF